MCGICGFGGRHGLKLEDLQVMTRTLLHRGPDSEGGFFENGFGLGIRRLSIIDLENGDQPVFSESKDIVAVLNGEIYNYIALRGHLRELGHTFTTTSDTECLVHLYEEYGVSFVEQLKGMYAFAIYDRQTQLLLIGRDRMGKKPVFYVEHESGLFFGSEIKAILSVIPGFSEPDTDMLYPFFRFGFIPEPYSFYKNIRKLPAASVLIYCNGQSSIRSYWDLSFGPYEDRNDKASVITKLDELLTNAVASRLMSDVPLGAFLSGGLDSSLVVAYMSKLLSAPVKTFTAGFDDLAFDETDDALRVASLVGADANVVFMSLESFRKDFFNTIDAIVHHTDEPFGDSSAFPTFHIAKSASEKVKVVLSGDGADEVFGGYTIYQGLKFASHYKKIPLALRQSLLQPLLAMSIHGARSRNMAGELKRWLKRIQDSGLSFRQMVASKLSIASVSQLALLLPEQIHNLVPEEITGECWIPFNSSLSEYEQMLYISQRFHQLNDMLVKLDRMSMAHGLEVRSPFLDRQVVEYAARIPMEMKIRGMTTKAIVRDLAARYLPTKTVRKKKHGFALPLRTWFQNDLFDEVRDHLERSSFAGKYIDKSHVSVLLTQHHNGDVDHSQLIWCMLILEAWDRKHCSRSGIDSG